MKSIIPYQMLKTLLLFFWHCFFENPDENNLIMEEKITGYKILSATTHQELESEVQQLIHHGNYKPHGDLKIIEIDRPDDVDKKHFMFLQPVVKMG